ncbi:hypothetical protein PIB30_029333 [Stylosanthes scabra]|uniref:Omega-hydroxypalmitate O-feruloyl transferase n=1 Tax=Stylosanthes scabra TaxID=79078 RepID=A0ABU6QAP7_9FABA|nr:hypothetical protein [Stylosanthes scabra]
MELVDKVVVYPEQPSLNNKRIFLSNIDLSLVVYQDTVSFFDPPSSEISFSEIYNKLCKAFSKLLVPYDFMAGRLVQSLEDSNRFEIECNDAGIVVIAARTDRKLSGFVVFAPSQDLEELAMFLREGEEEIDLKKKPLLSVQLTQFGCGSLALTTHYNHCTLDGLAVRDFEANLAALTRSEPLIVVPISDRTLLRARNPPKISHPHYEYAKATNTENLFSVHGTSNALVPGFARATVKELMESEHGYGIKKVQEGIERLDDEYIKSGIDWLELNKGMPYWEDSFSLVSWLKLGLEDQTFAWGQLKCSTPLTVKPCLIILLPGPPGDGGINISLDLPQDQMYVFSRIMLEEF